MFFIASSWFLMFEPKNEIFKWWGLEEVKKRMIFEEWIKTKFLALIFVFTVYVNMNRIIIIYVSTSFDICFTPQKKTH